MFKISDALTDDVNYDAVIKQCCYDLTDERCAI